MNIGAAKHRITFQYQTETDDGMGAKTVVWTNGPVVWASIWTTHSAEAVRSGQLTLDITHKIRLRYRSDIKASWRVNHGGKYYYIVSIIDPDMSHRTLDLLCKETET